MTVIQIVFFCKTSLIKLEEGELLFNIKITTVLISIIVSLSYANSPLVIDLSSSSFNTDYLIITPGKFLSGSIELAEFHNMSQNDNVSNAEIALLEDIQLKFNPEDSITKHIAVRNAIQEIFKKTDEKLRYVVFIGDDSIVFDSTDSIFVSEGNTPAYIRTNKTGSKDNERFKFEIYDDFYIDTTNLEYPNSKIKLPIHLGRIPCEDSLQLSTYIQKLNNYSSNFNSGEWRNRVTYLIDDGRTPYGVDGINHNALIEKVSKNGLASFFTNTCNASLYEKSSDSLHGNVNEHLISYINSGTMWVVYSGHGHYNCLGDEVLLEGKDIVDFTNTNQLPIFASFSCSNGRYVEPFENCMAKQFLFSPQGFIAYIASANVSYAGANVVFADSLFRAIEENPYKSLGENFYVAKNGWRGPSYVLLGDPALRLSFKVSQIYADFNEVVKTGDMITCGIDDMEFNEGNYGYNFSITDTIGQIYPHSYKINLIEKIIDSGSGTFYEDFNVEVPSNGSNDEFRLKVYCWNEKNEARFDTMLAMSVPISESSALKRNVAIKYVNGRILLSAGNLKNCDVEFLLYDVKGRTIISRSINSLASKLQLNLNDFNISAGKYIAVFRGKFGTQKIPIVFKK